MRTRRPPRQDWGLLPGRGSCHGNPITPETRDRLFSLFPRPSAVVASLSNSLHLSLHTLAPLSSSFTPASLSVARCRPSRTYDFSLCPSLSFPRTMFLSGAESRAGLAQAPIAAGGKVAEARGLQENLCLQDDIPCVLLLYVRSGARERACMHALPRDSYDSYGRFADLLPMNTRYSFRRWFRILHVCNIVSF